ncbi:HK97-gp10 family putative phage morphogenesis protein [Streptomyces sp. NPDC002666]
MPRRRGRGGATVRIVGLEQLRERLADLEPELIEASKRAVEASAEAVRDETRQNVRVKTGNLRDKVAVHYSSDHLKASVGWKNRADWYAVAQELGTKSIPAHPALGPAMEAERRRFEARLRAEIERIPR